MVLLSSARSSLKTVVWPVNACFAEAERLSEKPLGFGDFAHRENGPVKTVDGLAFANLRELSSPPGDLLCLP